MNKGLYTVTIEELDAFGDGVTRIEGVPVFIPFALKGEEVLIEVTLIKKTFARGKLKKVIKPSKDRVEPKCKNFYKCGGCSLMHLSYEGQLEYKKSKVINNFSRIAKLDIDIDKVVESPKQYGYRNKLSLPIRGEVGNISIGMYKRNSHEVIESDDCLLGGDWSNILTKIFKDYLNKEKVAPYNEEDFSGEIRHVVARFIDNQLLVMIVSNGEFKHKLDSLIEKLEKEFKSFGLFININNYKNNVIVGETTKHVYGIKTINTECLEKKIVLGPSSFYQINDDVKDIIYSDVASKVKDLKTEVLIDCFSGIGVLTNLVTRDEYKTYAIEIEESSIIDAKELNKLNGNKINNVQGDVHRELPRIIDENKDKNITLILDPPRKGIEEDICNLIKEKNISNFIYISCDSATLARDIGYLKDKYNVKSVAIYDMFPNTEHIETVCALSLKKSS